VNRLAAVARFWWEFVIGDDWLAAAAIALAIALTAALAHADITAWWLLPPAVAVILYTSLRRATRD
jgi:hypothetical protein